MEFFVQPYAISKDAVLLQIYVHSKNSFTTQKPSLTNIATEMVNKGTLGLWVVNSFEDKSIHLLVFFTVKIIEE